MLDLTKPLMIEGVGPVRLLTSDGRITGYPIIVEMEDGTVLLAGMDGESMSGNYRLINAPEPLVRWMVAYNGHGPSFADEIEAQEVSARNLGSRLFRIEIPSSGQPKIEEVK